MGWFLHDLWCKLFHHRSYIMERADGEVLHGCKLCSRIWVTEQ